MVGSGKSGQAVKGTKGRNEMSYKVKPEAEVPDKEVRGVNATTKEMCGVNLPAATVRAGRFSGGTQNVLEGV